MPLADDYRPRSFDEMVGQQRFVGPGGILRRMAEDKSVQNMIIYGPPGTGKTTAALILAESVNKPLFKLNAVSAGTSDIKALVSALPENGCVLYLDEIQYFNKKQQQSLLPYIESGAITLIASTTENPYHNVYDAILSRCIVIEFKRLTQDDVYQRLVNALNLKQPSSVNHLSAQVVYFLAGISSGDVRRAFNMIELLNQQYGSCLETVTVDTVKELLPTAQMAGFDTNGESHYQYISALQKSIRGSDPDAAVFYLMKLLEGGDIISPSRRMLVIACEDIGLAQPEAITHTLSCVTTAERLGLPEACKPLTQAAIYLALAPKSCSNEQAYMAAQDDIRHGKGANVPEHIRAEHTPGYLWPHAYPDHWVPQQYLPDDLTGVRYYLPDGEQEHAMYDKWQQIKKQRS